MLFCRWLIVTINLFAVAGLLKPPELTLPTLLIAVAVPSMPLIVKL